MRVGFGPSVASPRYIYASTATRRRRPPYPLLAGGAILTAVLAELLIRL
jgi:hypothetical protein